MKEIGIEKLIELLNEYEKEVKKSEKVWSIDNDGDICRQTYEGVDYNEYTEYMNTNNLISKSFGFIKWLVENEKIKWDEKFYLEDDEGLFGTYECLLMQLAIQDEPIRFLCEILK